MKVIKSDLGFLAYQKIFKTLLGSSAPVIVWQVDGEGRRTIGEASLSSFSLEGGLLHFTSKSKESLGAHLPVFFFCEEENFIFKSAFREIKERSFSVEMPSEIKILEAPDKESIKERIGSDISKFWKSKSNFIENEAGFLKIKSMKERSTRDQDFLNQEFAVSLDEEEKLYADKRESPRSRPKEEKWVKLKIFGHDDIRFFRMFDLSRGGIGFLATDPESFPKGGQVQIIGFEEFDLDDPLVGRIMSQRPIDENNIEFKIGVKFEEGQD